MIENYNNQIAQLLVYGDYFYMTEKQKSSYVVQVGQLNVRYGISITGNNRTSGGFPLFASNGIVDYIDKELSSNCVIFGCRGSLGNVFYSQKPCYVLNTAFYINCDDNYGNVFFSLRHEKGLTLYSSGAAQPQITIDSIKKATLTFISDTTLNTVLDRISELKDKVTSLERIKQNLLKKYFE